MGPETGTAPPPSSLFILNGPDLKLTIGLPRWAEATATIDIVSRKSRQ